MHTHTHSQAPFISLLKRLVFLVHSVGLISLFFSFFLAHCKTTISADLRPQVEDSDIG